MPKPIKMQQCGDEVFTLCPQECRLYGYCLFLAPELEGSVMLWLIEVNTSIDDVRCKKSISFHEGNHENSICRDLQFLFFLIEWEG